MMSEYRISQLLNAMRETRAQIAELYDDLTIQYYEMLKEASNDIEKAEWLYGSFMIAPEIQNLFDAFLTSSSTEEALALLAKQAYSERVKELQSDIDAVINGHSVEHLKDFAVIGILRSMPYDQYLTTPHWARVRDEAKRRANFRCQVCNSSKLPLHVHHRTYANRGDEQPEDLIVLCESCHQLFHENRKLSR